MIILSPKNRLQLLFSKTTKQMWLSPPQSGITQNGCTRAFIGTLTNEMLKSVPNFILTKKFFPLVLQRSGLMEHSITAYCLPSIENQSKYFWVVVIFNLFSAVVHFLKMNKCAIIPLVSLEARMCIELCAFSWCWCNCRLRESWYNHPDGLP